MNRESERGFTLVESLVSMLIISVIMLGLAAMLVVSIKVGHANEQRMRAVTVAESIVDDIRTRAKQLNYTTAQAQALAASRLQGTAYTPKVTLTPATVVPGPVAIHVELSWKDHGKTRNVSVDSQVVAE